MSEWQPMAIKGWLGLKYRANVEEVGEVMVCGCGLGDWRRWRVKQILGRGGGRGEVEVEEDGGPVVAGRDV